MLEPRIELLSETRLMGMKIRMSLINNKTGTLFGQFMPRRSEIKNVADTNFYSVECYDDPSYFNNFNPGNEFEKWAAVKVSDFSSVPPGIDRLIITKGEYAVFHYTGKPSEAQSTFQYIYTQWLPSSIFDLDDRPHFALMGPKYKGEYSDSEEEFWIPVKRK